MTAKGTTTAAKDQITTTKAKGYPDEPNTYTKVCDYNYPVNFKGAGIKEEGGRYVLAENGNSWNFYCDAASSLVASAALVVTVTTISMS